MRPEQVTDFKREIAALGDTGEMADLVLQLEELFEKYDLPVAPEISDRKRRRCKTEPLPIFTSQEGSTLRASRYKTLHGEHRLPSLWRRSQYRVVRDAQRPDSQLLLLERRR